MYTSKFEEIDQRLKFILNGMNKICEEMKEVNYKIGQIEFPHLNDNYKQLDSKEEVYNRLYGIIEILEENIYYSTGEVHYALKSVLDQIIINLFNYLPKKNTPAIDESDDIPF